MPNDALYDEMELTHPDYDAFVEDWTLYSQMTGRVPLDKQKLLPKGEFESNDQYKLRLSLAELTPESDRPVNKIVQTIYGQPISRKNIEDHKSFLDDATGAKTPYKIFIEDVLSNLLTFGALRVLVNLINPAAGASEKEEREAGRRVVCTILSPLMVTNWAFKESKSLEMVRIRESLHRVVDGAPKQVIRFTEYYEDRWHSYTFIEKKGDFKLLEEDQGVHDLGVVPMVFEGYPSEVVPGIGRGILSRIARADLRKVRAESDVHYATYCSAHNVLVYKGSRKLGDVGVGEGSYVHIDEDEDLQYLEFPHAAIEAQRMVVSDNLRTMERFSGADPLSQSESGDPHRSSGASRAWSFGTSEGRVMKKVAKSMEFIEMQIFDMHDRWLTTKNFPPTQLATQVEVNYPENYNPANVETTVEAIERAKPVVVSKTLWTVLEQRLARHLAGDLPNEVYDEIDKELEKSNEEPVEPPMPDLSVGMDDE